MKNTENEVIYAPIEIESEEQMRDLGLKQEDCRTWKIGNSRVLVYLVPANQETRDFLLAELYTRHTQERRKNRCVVPGLRKAWIQCPSENSCSDCPYGYQYVEGGARCLSLEKMLEDGFDSSGWDDTSDTVTNREELRCLYELLNEADPNLVRIVELQAAGFSVAEIADKMGVSQPTVYRALQKIHQLAQDYRENS